MFWMVVGRVRVNFDIGGSGLTGLLHIAGRKGQQSNTKGNYF